jgi:hypothetical protein
MSTSNSQSFFKEKEEVLNLIGEIIENEITQLFYIESLLADGGVPNKAQSTELHGEDIWQHSFDRVPCK